MKKLLLLSVLLIVGCDETLEPNPNPCIPDLVCGEAVTCCDANCDDEIGICDTTNP